MINSDLDRWYNIKVITLALCNCLYVENVIKATGGGGGSLCDNLRRRDHVNYRSFNLYILQSIHLYRNAN